MATTFPLLLLTITPLCDVVRMVTFAPAWSQAAMWAAVAGVVVAAAAVTVELFAWLATAPHTHARQAGAAPLMLHLAALWPLALGVVERFHGAAAHAAGAAPRAALLWPLSLALVAAFAWLVGDWTAEPRDVRYQPTGLPSRA